MRYILVLLVLIIGFSCKKSDSPNPPESTTLVFPENNSECTTGIDLSLTTSMVEFRWQEAANVDTYELRATNVNTNTTQTVSTSSLSANLPLQKGTLYSWVVTTTNNAVLQSATSLTSQFYNAGFQTSYAPFPAEIITPELGESVFKDGNNEVVLSWSGADIDNDIESYEVFFSTENPPTSLVATNAPGNLTSEVTVETDTVYYWNVITTDSEGNTSDSGVVDFRVF